MGRRKSKRTNLINLDRAIVEVINEYGDDVYKVLGDCVDEVTKEATEKLQGVDTFRTSGHAGGPYSGDWTNETVTDTRINKKEVVYNEDNYRLTHLLENGHVIRNGTGRTFGRTGKFPHIVPVSDWAEKELPQLVKRKLESL